MTLGGDGFSEKVEMIDGLEGHMLSTYTFSGPDEFTQVSEIHAPGGVTISTPETFRRRR